MARILFNHLFKHYGKEHLPLVKDFHLEINEGEFMVFVGPSGCGKSTTLRMVAGLEGIRKRSEIHVMVERSEQLGQMLQQRDIDFVLCHADMHPGNILLDSNDELAIVDWDSLRAQGAGLSVYWWRSRFCA